MGLAPAKIQSRVQRSTHGCSASSRTDAHNLFAADRSMNSARSNKGFDEGGRVAGKAQMVTGGRETPFEASLAKPFYDRPGHWGVPGLPWRSSPRALPRSFRGRRPLR